MLKIKCEELIKLNEIITGNGIYFKNNSPCSIIASLDYIDSDFEKIVYVYYKLIKNHHFIDGNKRTATIFLLSIYSNLNDDFLFDTAINIAENKLNLDDVKSLIKNRI